MQKETQTTYRYGFNDIVLVGEDKELPKYLTVRDTDGNIVGEIECYLVEEETEDVYYQPDFGNDDTLTTPDGTELWSYYVYSSKELAKQDFPDREILEFSGDDIENPYFVK